MNLVHFHVNNRKSEILGFAVLYLPKEYKDLDKNYRRVTTHEIEK